MSRFEDVKKRMPLNSSDFDDLHLQQAATSLKMLTSLIYPLLHWIKKKMIRPLK